MGWNILDGYDNIKEDSNLEKYPHPISYGPFDNQHMESPILDTPRTSFIGSNRRVGKVGWTPDEGGTVWIDGKGSKAKFKPGASGFHPVPEDVWNFHVGGYQVCEKWLKDRGPKKGKPGRILTDEDVAHYHKIVIALTETIRLMAEIDHVIDAHGGWPDAFATLENARN